MSKYVVYVMQNPLNKGDFQYQDLAFEYEPLYVGSGRISRTDDHNNRNDDQIFIDIRDAGLKLIPIVVYNTDDREEAFNVEMEYIKKIGRKITMDGPLVNERNGYSVPGPFALISPDGEVFYVSKSDLYEFTYKHNTSYRSHIRSYYRFLEMGELRKGNSGNGRGWTCILADYLDGIDHTDNAVLKHSTVEYLRTFGIDFDEFVASDPICFGSEPRTQAAATAGKRASEVFMQARIEGMKVCHEVYKANNLMKYGFKSDEEARSTFADLHYNGLLSTRQIADKHGCSQCYVISRMDKLMSRSEICRKRRERNSMSVNV